MSQKSASERAIDAIVGAIDKALAEPAPPKPEEVAAKTISAAIKGRFNGDPAVEKRIVEIDAKWVNRRSVLENSGYAAAKSAHLKHQVFQQQMLTEGRFDGDFYTLEEYVSDFAQMGMAARREMAMLSQQAAVLCRPICQAVARLLNDQAAEVEQADRTQHEKYSVQFTGSPLAERLRQLADQTMRRVASGGGSRPSHYCGYLIKD